MNLELSIIQLITICAVANGFVFALLILLKTKNREANIFLAILILTLSLTFTPYMLDPSVWHHTRLLAWVPFALSYWIGPSLYFYVSSVLKKHKFEKRDLWHFTPVILNYIHSIYHWQTCCDPLPWFHGFAELLESAAIISIFIYMYLSYRLITQSEMKYSSDIKENLSWLKNLIVTIAITFAAILIFLIITTGIFGMEQFHQWNNFRAFVLASYVGILYWLSINGYRQHREVNVAVNNQEDVNNYLTSDLLSQLTQLMTHQQLYRNPDFGMSELSTISGFSERAISQALNGEMGKNFNQYVNHFRVEEMKNKLSDPKMSHLKIISLALDSGFNSKASFNRIFKSFTGSTPKQYKEENSRHSS